VLVEIDTELLSSAPRGGSRFASKNRPTILTVRPAADVRPECTRVSYEFINAIPQ